MKRGWRLGGAALVLAALLTFALPNATADANGIRQFISGTGGKNMDGFGTPTANSLVRMSGFGVLKLTLGTDAYAWQFVNEAGNVLDSGTGTCH